MANIREGNKSRLKEIAIITGFSILYLVLSSVLIGFKPTQLILVGLFCVLYFVSATTRKLILGFLIFIIYWIIFDYMKLFPNYRFNTVHIEDLYELEKRFFGIRSGGAILTPHEYIEKFQSSFWDVMSGIFYLCWVPVPMLAALYFFFRKRDQFLKFLLTFLWINLIGFVVYYIYPAAPPWYIEQYGTVFNPATRGNTAGLQRFDLYFGVQIFHNIYAQSSNVFAAMPSLHAAYPMLVLYYGLKNKLGPVNIAFAVVMVGIWFSAVYTGHHYLMDVLAGIICCITGIVTFNMIVKRNPVKRWLDIYLRIIQ